MCAVLVSVLAMFFYDKILDLYINESPLLISSRILEFARSLDLQLKWDDKGRVCGITHDVSMAVATVIGSTTLSVSQYMALAVREPRAASTEFAEWLTDRYTYKEGIMFDSDGSPTSVSIARPGWFDLENTDEHGIPNALTRTSSPGKWKFWSLVDPTIQSGAVRSFVTSSGTCSLDLGIPVFAQHSRIMIREAYRCKPCELDCPLDRTFAKYQSLVMKETKNDAALERLLLSLSAEDLAFDHSLDSMITEKRKEMTVDLVGKRRVLLDERDGLQVLDYNRLLSVLPSYNDQTDTVVLGHSHPDADAIISAIFEAARRNLISNSRKHVPWAEYLPAEVLHILGPTLSGLVASEHPSGHHTFVLVDCQDSAHADSHLVHGVIDHHPCSRQFPYYVAQSYEVSWSSTLQVYIKLLGSGFELDHQTARILAEATILEAEPQLLELTGIINRLALDRLKKIASHMVDYSILMAIMTEATDHEYMFWKDYKEDNFGFAVIKHQRPHHICFSDLAEKNNSQKHLPLTAIKQVSYNNDFSKVEWEVITVIFNKAYYDKGFRAAVFDVIKHTCAAFHGHLTTTVDGTSIKIRGGRSQTPRLLLMPLIKTLVDEHLKFVYSNLLGRYVACGFYSNGQDGIPYSLPNSECTVKAGLCFQEVKDLLRCSGNVSFLSLPEFWTLFKEFSDWRHVYTSLTDGVYVELLNTQVKQGDQEQSIIFNGMQSPVTMKIPLAQPAQLRPHDCLEVNGIPTKLVSPNVYDDTSLWRYWSPDSDTNVATRGHIFAINRPCIDLKIKPVEKTKRLTFRPIYRNISEMKYEMVDVGGRWIDVHVHPRLFTIFEVDV